MPANSSSTQSNAARCQHRTASGRQCRSLVGDSSSGLCPHHAAIEESTDFREALTRNAYCFQKSQGVNNSLGVLFNLLAEGRISPRRASVLAYISSLLLRTLPAIDYDNKYCTFSDEQEAPEQTAPEPAAASPTPRVGPGKEPLPATAQEFAAAVLNRKLN